MLTNFKLFIRQLKRQKSFSIINILGLSIGLAFCLLILLYVHDELSFDHFHEQQRQIYRILVEIKSPQGSMIVPFTQIVLRDAVQNELPDIQKSARNFMGTHLVKVQGKAFTEEILYTDPEFFDIFSFGIKDGNIQDAFNTKHSIVLSRRMAEKYFGRENVIGETMSLQFNSGFSEYMVSGIIENVPLNSSIQFDFAIPFSNLEELWGTDNIGNWGDFSIATYLLLNPQSQVMDVEKKINQIASKNMGSIFGEDFKPAFLLQPFIKTHLDSNLSFASTNGIKNISNPIYSYILSGLAYFILVIACINFTNISMAQAIPRSKEIGIRKSIGANPGQLRTQFLSESLLSTCCAFILAIILVEIFLPFFNRISGKSLLLSFDLGIPFLLTSFILIVITTVMAGGFPAFVMSGFDPVKALSGKIVFKSKNKFSRFLLAIQFTISIFLIITMLTIRQQLKYVSDASLGYNDQNVVLIPTFGEDIGRLVALFRNELSPYSFSVTADSRYGNRSIVNHNKEDEFESDHCKIDDDYLQIMEIQLISGRTLSSEYLFDPQQSILVNEAFVKKVEMINPVGEKINYQNGSLENPTIVGVVRDFHYKSLHEKIDPLILHMDPAYKLSTLLIKIPDQNISRSISLIESTWKRLVPYTPFQYQFLSVQNRNQYRTEENWRAIIGYSAFFALFISLMGLLGMSAIHLKSRTKEISIRKVLGISFYELLRCLTYDLVVLIFIAISVSVPVSIYLLNQWLNKFAYRTNLNIWIILLAALFTLVVSLVAIAYQVLRAALANPIIGLRYE
ncbi:ABC transporter permease [bacterium]|nr:ABC transporter permease [bacterium]RQV94747.1 MAG: ABC transporter permease [bacterium]